MKKDLLWDNAGHVFEKYYENWGDEKKYILYGAGNLGEEFFEKFHNDIEIEVYTDSDANKWDSKVKGLDVIEPSIAIKKGLQIIITSRFYFEIKTKLEEFGLVEDVDFTKEQKFESIFRFYKEGILYFRELDISITPACTLKCKDCNMQMLKYKDKRHYEVSKLKKDIDDYFEWVDHVQFVGILGGEPFLHPQLLEYLKYIVENYRSRMTILEVLTNGTIMPDEKMWKYFRDNNISIQLSDYSVGVPSIKNRICEFLNKAISEGVKVNILNYESWLDFGYNTSIDDSDEIAIERFKYCNNPWRSVDDGRFYYCNLQRSAYKAGLANVDASDYFSLENYSTGSKVYLLEYDLKCVTNGSLSMCKNCYGCSDVNKHYVNPAVQQV